ncbi:MAG: aminomethyl-transferring glycine dehydrogenase subunit GcvPB [Armatimonadetes bacterium]|nr:aminomethyl-transferring glycine dehydrogenase subunit GcvPB [Armatimonadota bacterium]
MKLSFEKSVAGRRSNVVPPSDVPERPLDELLPAALRRGAPARLPEMAEPEVVRHFVALSRRNFGVDVGFYPLGSCTMKYNPKINERCASLPAFLGAHPLAPDTTVQGTLAALWELERLLSTVCGMAAFSLVPAAGAHGELAGMMVIQAYHQAHGGGRRKVIVPDAAHGTNPASAALCGYEVVQVRSNERGGVDLDDLRSMVDPQTAALMLTNPNTLGLFEDNILEVAEIVHQAGALLYYDGANLNGILGRARPGDMGFDVVHVNVHKTFSTPHGGGGPGAGPVGVAERLRAYLPLPRVTRQGEHYALETVAPESVGPLLQFHGNVGVLLRALCYLRAHGPEELRQVSGDAVLNANYLRSRLQGEFDVPYQRSVMHEFALSGRRQKAAGSSTLDIAKRLIDFGYHPPTIYWPLLVEECMLIEPVETETRETLDAFAEAMLRIAEEVRQNPGFVHAAPHTAPVKRLDEVRAARQLDLRWRFEEDAPDGA